MPADVIINPTSGEIYWNDGTGSPQSISIRGDSQNKIDIIGYSASFSPGGSGVGTFVLATFNDNSGAAAFAPGTSGNELGSSLLRWKPYLTTTTISDSASSLGTNSTTLLTGVIQVNGGIAISGNASIGQSVLFFNKTNPIYFVGISAPASLASTTNYFLPTNYPGAGTSILQSNTTGTLSWVPLVASSAGLATTAQNVQVILVGNPNSQHSLLLTPTVSSAGSAVSGNGTLVYNPSTDVLSTPGLAVTSAATAVSYLNAPALITGGLAVGDNIAALNKIGVGVSTSAVTRAEVHATGTDVGLRIFETTGAQPRVNLARNAAGTNVPALAFQNTSGNFSSTGSAIGVPDATTTASIAIFASNGTNGNVIRFLVYGGATRVTTNEISLGDDVSGTATTSLLRGVNASGTDISTSEFIIQAGRSTGTGINAGIRFLVATPATSTGSALNAGRDVVKMNTSQNSTSTASGTMIVYGGMGLSGNAFIGGSTHVTGVSWINNATNATSSSNAAEIITGGLAVGTNAIIGGSTLQSGVSWINNSTNATNSSTGALIVTGGLALGSNAIIGGSTIQSGVSWINNTTASTSTSTGALIVGGGVGVGQSVSIGGRLQLFNGATNYTAFVSAASASTTYTLPALTPAGTAVSVLQSTHEGILSWVPMASVSASGLATTSQNVQVQLVGNPNTQHSVLLTPTVSSAGSAVSGNGTLVYNPLTDILSTPGLAVTSTTATTSTTTGAARVSGGIGIVGNAFIGGTINVASPITIPNGGTNASSFGQTAGFIYYDGANIRLAAATGASINFTNGYYQFDNRVYATSFFANNSQIPNGSGGSGRVTYWSGNNTIASNTNFLWDNTNNIFTVLGNTIGIGLTASGIAATSTLNATSTTSAALTVTGGFALGSNAIIGGSTVQAGVAWINNSTNATTSSSAALYVSGGLAVGSNAIIGGSTLQSGVAWINNSTNATSSSAGALIVTGGLALGTNAFIGGSTHIVGIDWVNNATNATSSSAAALRVTGGLALGTNAIIGGSTLQSGVSWINNSTNATNTATGALIVTGGLALGTNAIIGGSTLQSGVSWINNATNATTSATGALVVTGGLALGANAIIGGSTVQAGVAWINNSTNATTTSSAALYVTGGLAVGTNAFIGGTFTHTDTTDSLATNAGSIVTRGGVGIARNAAIGASLLFTNSTNANLVGFRAGVTAANTMYVLPLNYPGSGTSVLTSDTSGTLSWSAAATGSGSPGGNATEIQFNNGGTFGGATGLTYQSTLYLTSIASTADQRAVTTVGLRLINSSTVSIAGVQVRYSPALELVGKAVVNPSTEYFNRFVTDAYGTTGFYAAQQQWKYSYDTGTPGYSNPLFIIHSQKGVGIGRSNIIYQSFFVANASQAAELTYVLPVAYPGTGTSVLSSDTTGNLSWVPSGTGSGTPGGSTRQVQYNNGGSFGGATGFEYVSAGNAVTVSYFSAAGGGSTVGMVICAVNGTTTRVGIGLTNPAFELEILGEISATNKSFVIDHPTKSGMKLRYGSLEGPENGVYVRGQLVGSNVIVPPDHWFGLVHEDSYTVHLTPIGNYQNLYIEKIEDYKVYVGTASTFDVNCYYSVWAERKDIPKLIVEY